MEDHNAKMATTQSLLISFTVSGNLLSQLRGCDSRNQFLEKHFILESLILQYY